MNSTLIFVLFVALFGFINCAPSSPDDSIAKNSENSSADDLQTASTFYGTFGVGFPAYAGYGGSPYGYGGSPYGYSSYGYPGSIYGGYGGYGSSYYGYPRHYGYGR